jgi:hypothetical protein
MKCDLVEIAKHMIEIVSGKSSPAASVRDTGGSDVSLKTKKGTLSAKRKRSLALQIEAATGSEPTESKSARKQTDDR